METPHTVDVYRIGYIPLSVTHIHLRVCRYVDAGVCDHESYTARCAAGLSHSYIRTTHMCVMLDVASPCVQGELA